MGNRFKGSTHGMAEDLSCEQNDYGSDHADSVTMKLPCITAHERFEVVWLNVWVLQAAYFQYRQHYGDDASGGPSCIFSSTSSISAQHAYFWDVDITIEWPQVHLYSYDPQWLCRVGEHQHWLAGTSMFTMGKFCTHMKCEVKHNWDVGTEHLLA